MAADQCASIHFDSSSSNGWMKDHPGLTLDAVFRQTLAVAGPRRLLFGTDSSFFPRGWQWPVLDAQLAAMKAARVSETDRDLILAGNFNRLFTTKDAHDHQHPRRDRRHHLRARHDRSCLHREDDADAQATAAQPADLVITNGKIVTVENGAPQAEAIAIRGGRIVAIGTAAEMKALIGPATEVIDVKGQLVIPGFIEGHGHFTGVGTAQLNLNLMNTTSWDEIVAMVAETVEDGQTGRVDLRPRLAPGEVDGAAEPERRGLPDPRVAQQGLAQQPRRAHARERPRQLRQRQGDGAVRHDRKTREPGRRRHPQGRGRQPDRPAARDRLAPDPHRHRREPDRRERRARARQILELASKEVVSKGVTSFHDAGSSFADVDLMKAMVDEGKIGIRLWMMLRVGNAALAENMAKYRMIDYGSGFSPSARSSTRSTARWVRAARGCSSPTPTSPTPPASTPRRSDDRGNRRARDAARLPTLRPRDRRSRQPRDARHLRRGVQGESRQEGRPLARRARAAPEPDDIPRFGQLGVIASMQGIHCTSDAPYVPPASATSAPRKAPMSGRS